MQIDIVRNQIGGMVNNFLAQDVVSPKEMRYILKAILGEVAEMELTQVYMKETKMAHTQEEVENG